VLSAASSLEIDRLSAQPECSGVARRKKIFFVLFVSFVLFVASKCL